jgi:TATA-box binding protein (TBP) (component of TFIID and TFIIIB)
MPNNKKTQHRILQIIQDLVDRFNVEGYNITVNADLMSKLKLNDIQLTFSNYERNTTEQNN